MTTYNPQAAIDEILRQVTSSTEALTKRLSQGGDRYQTLVDSIRLMGKTADALEIGLALDPTHPAMDRLMRSVAAELCDAMTAVKHMDRHREAAQKKPKVVPTERVTLH
jgi:hypothetical protein